MAGHHDKWHIHLNTSTRFVLHGFNCLTPFSNNDTNLWNTGNGWTYKMAHYNNIISTKKEPYYQELSSQIALIQVVHLQIL